MLFFLQAISPVRWAMFENLFFESPGQGQRNHDRLSYYLSDNCVMQSFVSADLPLGVNGYLLANILGHVLSLLYLMLAARLGRYISFRINDSELTAGSLSSACR